MWSAPLFLLLAIPGLILASPDSDAETHRFLDRVSKSIELKDVALISSLFTPDFYFNGCKGIYKKDKVVQILSHSPDPISFTFKSSEFVLNDSRIRYTVEVSGFGEMVFFLSRAEQQLVGGLIPGCRVTRRSLSAKEAVAGPEFGYLTALRFVMELLEVIKTQNQARIGTYFDGTFKMIGCERTYARGNMIQMLSHLPANTPFQFEMTSARALFGNETEIIVEGTAFGYSYLKVSLIFDWFKRQLNQGRRLECPKALNHFHGTIGSGRPQMSAHLTVSNFMAQMEKALNHNRHSIDSMFQENFYFKGCRKYYNTNEMVTSLLDRPANTEFEFRIQNVHDYGSVFKFEVTATGFGPKTVNAQLFYNRNTRQLESGLQPHCRPVNRHHSRAFHGVQDSSSEDQVKSFLVKLETAVRAKDSPAIINLFKPEFQFKGCEGTYDRNGSLALFLQIPSGVDISYTVESVQDLGDTIKSVVIAEGMKKSIHVEFEFILSKKDQQLESASMKCPTRRFYRFQGSSSEDQIKNFLVKLETAVRAKDSPAIISLFKSEFQFKGCEGTYDRNGSLALFLQIPSAVDISYTIESVQDLGDTIKSVVIAEGMKKSIHVEFEFILSKKDQQLESASMKCPSRRFYRFHDSSSEDQIKNFLVKLETAVRAKDSPAIISLFKPEFQFKGCEGTYDRNGSLALFLQIPSGVDISYTIESVQDLGDTIKSVVIAEGMKKSIHVEFEFVLSKKDQQLESASMKCPTRRFYRFQGSSSEDQIKSFLAKLETAVRAKDSPAIISLFKPEFEFKGCEGAYDRNGSLALFLQIPSAVDISYTIESVQDLGDTIKSVVIAEGMKKSIHVEFEFILSKKDQQLESASMKCPSRRFVAAAQKEDQRTVVFNFLKKFVAALEGSDPYVFLTFFEDNFMFKGCKQNYNKTQMVDVIYRVPSGNRFGIELGPIIYDLGTSLRYTIKIKGFAPEVIEAVFVLNKSSLKLESGHRKNCPKAALRLFDQDGASTIIYRFLSEMTSSIKSRNAILIGTLFDEGFEFKGCKGTYEKYQVVGILSQLPKNAELSIDLQSAAFISDSAIEYTVAVSGMGDASKKIEARFVLDSRIEVLLGGNILECPTKSQFSGVTQFRVDGVHGAVDVKHSGLEAALDPTESLVHDFLIRLTVAVVHKDYQQILGLFQDAFVFKGCKGQYTKAQVVDMLCRLPERSTFTIDLLAVHDQGDTISYTVSAVGFGAAGIQAEFILNKATKQLVSGSIPLCQTGTLGDSNGIAVSFLAKMNELVTSRNAKDIAAVFDEKFEFKTCDGTVQDKAASVDKMSTIPSFLSVDFKLVSSEFNSQNHVEATLDIVVTGFGSTRTRFVLDPSRNVLVSGYVMGC